MSKKIIVIAALLLAIGALAGCVTETNQPVQAPIGVSSLNEATKGIFVSGNAEVSVKPDMATVALGVISRDKVLNTAQQANTAAMTAVVDALKKTVKEENISTSNLNVNPVYNYQNPQPVIEGYEINNTVTVNCEDILKIGQIVDEAMAAGANQVYGITFSIKDDKESYAKAMSLAIEDARRKAAVIAEAAGMKIDGIVSITENGSSQPIRYERGPAAADMAQKGIGSTIQTGSVSVMANVSIVFGYK